MHAHGGLLMEQNCPGKSTAKLPNIQRGLKILAICSKRRYYWDRRQVLTSVKRTQMCGSPLVLRFEISGFLVALLSRSDQVILSFSNLLYFVRAVNSVLR